MKTAVIVAGVCRFTDISHKSWTMLPEADWYLSTWDISQKPYSTSATSSVNEIAKIKHLFHTVLISNYQDEYLNTEFQAYDRPFILLEKIYKEIKDAGYKRIIYFRPDLMLFSLDGYSHNDFIVNDNTLRVLDCYDPDFWIQHHRREMQDSFFVITWKSFELLVNSREKVANYSIHSSLYNFLENHQIQVVPLYNMRSVILRDNVYEYKSDLSWGTLTSAFSETYIKNNHVGKFPKTIELKINRELDYEKIKVSQTSGGILKLRDKQEK